jgi:DNA-binding NarL/FixJ family response regulator
VSNSEIPWLSDVAWVPLVDSFPRGDLVLTEQAFTKVLIADDRARVRFALGVLLGKLENIEVVGEATDAEGLMERTQECCPDLVLVDWDLPGLNEGPFIRELQNGSPETKLVVLSGQPEVRAAAIQAGADSFVNKTEGPSCLLLVIEKYCGAK